MNELLKLSFSMFSIIAAGFLIVRLKIINESGEKALTDLVLSVILPCNVFCSFFAGNFENLAADCFWILMISVGVQVIALLYTRFVFRMQNKKQQCDLSYAMISPNTGFFGSPIAESIFGPVGLMLTCIYLIPQRLVMWSVGLSMFTGVSEKLREKSISSSLPGIHSEDHKGEGGLLCTASRRRANNGIQDNSFSRRRHRTRGGE